MGVEWEVGRYSVFGRQGLRNGLTIATKDDRPKTKDQADTSDPAQCYLTMLHAIDNRLRDTSTILLAA
jgi:hypothetical protein